MKIKYKSTNNIELFLDTSVIKYLKNIATINLRSMKLWEKVPLSLVDDKKNIIWTKELKDITDKDLGENK